jgi:hypothetical protein
LAKRGKGRFFNNDALLMNSLVILSKLKIAQKTMILNKKLMCKILD